MQSPLFKLQHDNRTYLQKITTASSAFWPCSTTRSRATPSSKLTEIVANTAAEGEAASEVRLYYSVKKILGVG